MTASLGTPYSIPMEETLEDENVKYYPLTIEHPAEEYSGSWTLGNPAAYVSGANNDNYFSFIAFASKADECYAQLALPKFTVKGHEGAVFALNAYLYDNMAEAVIYVRGNKEELPVGTITKGNNEEGWKKFEFLLPAEVSNWGWAEIVVRVSFTSMSQFFLMDYYSVNPWSGVNEMTASDVEIFGADDAIIVKNAPQGSTLDIFTMEGRAIISRRIDENFIELSVNPGIYVARCGNKTAKVVVK